MGLGFSFPADLLRLSPPLEITAADLLESGVSDLEGLAAVVDGGALILSPAPPRSFSRRTDAAVDISVVIFFKGFWRKKGENLKGF